MVALLVSVTMSWRAKTSLKLNMSGLDFLVLALQISNSFDLNAFLQALFSLILTFYKGHIKLLHLRTVCLTGLFGLRQKCISIPFYRLKTSKNFPVKTHVFEKTFKFCTFVCNDGGLSLRLHMVALLA